MRTLLRFALLFFTVVTPMHAQTGDVIGARGPIPVRSGAGSVTGHVYCADTNAPARFARVTAFPAGRGNGGGVFLGGASNGTTGLDGSFTLTGLAPGSYYLVASLPGYLNPMMQVSMSDVNSTDPAAQARAQQVLSSPISINGTETARAELRLARGAAVSGTVYFDDGSPAVGLVVTAHPVTTTSSTAHPTVTGFSEPGLRPTTDEMGRYRIAGLAPGDYTISATSPMVMDFGGGYANYNRSQTLTIYAPKAISAADAKSFTAQISTEVTGADIQVPLNAFHAVSGAVSGTDGRSINSGSVSLADKKDKTRTYRTNLRADGTFRFDYVPEGDYTLSVSSPRLTESTGRFNNRGSQTVQSYNDTTQSVTVQSGDLIGVTVNATPKTATNTTSPQSQN